LNPRQRFWPLQRFSRFPIPQPVVRNQRLTICSNALVRVKNSWMGSIVQLLCNPKSNGFRDGFITVAARMLSREQHEPKEACGLLALKGHSPYLRALGLAGESRKLKGKRACRTRHTSHSRPRSIVGFSYSEVWKSGIFSFIRMCKLIKTRPGRLVALDQPSCHSRQAEESCNAEL